MEINKNTNIISKIHTKPIEKAMKNLLRDIEKTCLDTNKEGIEIRLIPKFEEDECYEIIAKDEGLNVYAKDDLGFIYGIYEISRSILNITDLWFWNDQNINKKEGYEVSDNFKYKSSTYKVRYRGWFINDEVLISTWKVNRKKEVPWEMIFEALLRLGGNMVIPGTDTNSKIYRKLASSMGLYITHHHAEPLGSEMFSRVYPDLEPSYDLYEDKFKELWKSAIEKQKDMKVIWNLGFRGQGDKPFWENDNKYQTIESRGKLISDIIKIQYNMVKSVKPNAVFCTNLYGEIMELYNQNALDLPEDIIKIYADNGYGKMVSRRQGNKNLRVNSMVNKEDISPQGIYYHVSFYDLQAANHITMLSNSPEFIKNELLSVLSNGGKDYWIINCSNVKPHVYYLDFISKIWKVGDIDIEEHKKDYIKKYYGTKHNLEIKKCLDNYWKDALRYGENEDDHAGEQFSNHVARILINQYMKDSSKAAKGLLWAVNADSLKKQVLWYYELCKKACINYSKYLKECENVSSMLDNAEKLLFDDSILLQAQIHYYCFNGAKYTCKSILKSMEDDYKMGFYIAGKARKLYLKADLCMRNSEHGKWHKFYANECLTDVKQSAYVLEGLMSYLRNIGDGPHFFKWMREYLYSEEDSKVMLILNKENHLKDDELFELMEERLEK